MKRLLCRGRFQAKSVEEAFDLILLFMFRGNFVVFVLKWKSRKHTFLSHSNENTESRSGAFLRPIFVCDFIFYSRQ